MAKKRPLNRLEKSRRLRTGETPITLNRSGEEGVEQMRVLLGLRPPLVTNVNLPNSGQLPQLPIGAVVETNAVFSSDSVTPVLTGKLPVSILPLLCRICAEQEALDLALSARDIRAIEGCFVADPLTTCSLAEAKALFREMVTNTAAYLDSYDLTVL